MSQRRIKALESNWLVEWLVIVKIIEESEELCCFWGPVVEGTRLGE